MVIAAGKSGGKPPRITDNAFKPPTEAAMAMTSRAGMHGELLINNGLTKFYWAWSLASFKMAAPWGLSFIKY